MQKACLTAGLSKSRLYFFLQKHNLSLCETESDAEKS
jgi:hypothetical protein